MYKPISPILHLLLLIIFIGAFGSSAYYIKADSIVPPAATLPSEPVLSTPIIFEPISEPGWTLLQPGLEKRVFEIYDNQNQHVESLHIWRLDQRYFRLDVAYEAIPKTLARWQEEMNALLVMNGGYYSIDNESYFPDGLTIVNGAARGRSFGGSAGMLAIHDGGAEIRWLAQRPYQPSEPLRAALQSFPVLVEPGGRLGFGPERESHASARRTVIAQDRSGRILFIIAPQGYFTLHQLSVYLTESELDLDSALNLDGGGSTGILVADPQEVIPPTRPLPFVILVYPR